MKIFKLSFWLCVLENIIYIAPTLGTVLYYYFSELEQSISQSSKFTFGLALTLFVLIFIYKSIAKRKIEELRASVIQTETDLKNTVASNTEQLELLAKNAKKDRLKLDLYDKGMIIITFVIVALGVGILERAMIGLTYLSYIACISVLAGFGVHIGVLELKKNEQIKTKKRGK